MKYKILKSADNRYRYSGEARSYYLVILEEGPKPYVAFYYDAVSASDILNSVNAKKKGGEYTLLPSGVEFVSSVDAKDYRGNRNRYSSNLEYTNLGSDVESYGFYIPREYTHKPCSIEIIKDPIINDDMLEALNNAKAPQIIVGEDYSKRRRDGDTAENDILEVIDINEGEIFYVADREADEYRYRGDMITMKEFKAFREEQYRNSYGTPSMTMYQSSRKDKLYYVSVKENGFVIYYVSKEVNASNNKITVTYRVENSMEHLIGEKTAAYRHLKRSIRDCDSFDAMHINSQNIMYLGDIKYEGATDFYDFCRKNEKLIKMSGFHTAMKYTNSKWPLKSFFIVYLAILNKYPVLEQIVKMGHSKLFFSLYEDIVRSGNKQQIAEKVERLNELVNNEATKGKEALRFPFYVGDYLIKKDATLEEYYGWRDMYEITQITKEQFENYIDSLNYAWLNSQIPIRTLCNILKFGYPIEKLSTYLIKQSDKEESYYRSGLLNLVNTFADYLNMCDVLGVTPDKYPQDVQKQHDDIAAIYREKQREEESKKIRVIGEQCEKYVVPKEDELDKVGVPKLFKELTVVFPKSINDFIEEGNQQHNCVGSYPRYVKEGSKVIFFIRKKDEPSKSFITAECTKSGLGQCYYSNNRYVNNPDYQKFASYIANMIKKGCASGKISALTR